MEEDQESVQQALEIWEEPPEIRMGEDPELVQQELQEEPSVAKKGETLCQEDQGEEEKCLIAWERSVIIRPGTIIKSKIQALLGLYE